MKLPPQPARDRLVRHDHGVLSTLHRVRGVDAVPCVYAVVGDDLGVPIDRVKPKSSTRLQRQRNLEEDPRATLLVEHWDRDDWSQLWWVRAELRWDADADDRRSGALSAQLAERFEPYRDEPFERILVFRIVAVSGWAASG